MPRIFRFVFGVVIIQAAELIFRTVYQGLKIKPSVVHCHDTIMLPSALLIKLILGSLLVYDAHELESDKNGSRRFLSAITIFLEKLSWKQIDLFITVSRSILDWYHNKYGSKINSVVILNSPLIRLNKDIGNKYDDYLRSYFKIPEHIPIFLYVGILSPGRGLEKIIDAFNSPSIQAHVAFVGYGEMLEYLTDISKSNNKVHVHGPVPHTEVVALAASADVGLCLIENISLSDYLCLPNKLFEYCFAGIPVLASNFPELRRVISDYNLGICVDLDIEAIISSIESFNTDIKPDNTRAIADLSWEAQAKKLVLSYNTITKHRKNQCHH